MPSIWCPKCQTNKHRADKCPKCGFIEEYTTKTYYIPQGKKARVLQGKPKKTSINFEFDKNKIIIMTLLSIITLSLAYIAYDKFRERSEIEQSLQYMTGVNSADEYYNATTQERMEKINNSQMMKDAEVILGEASKKQAEQFNNFLGKQ